MSESFWNTINWGALIAGAIGGLLSGTLIPAMLQHYRWYRERKEQKEQLGKIAAYDPSEGEFINKIQNQIDSLDLLSPAEAHFIADSVREVLKKLILSGHLERERYNGLLRKIKKAGY